MMKGQFRVMTKAADWPAAVQLISRTADFSEDLRLAKDFDRTAGIGPAEIQRGRSNPRWNPSTLTAISTAPLE